MAKNEPQAADVTFHQMDDFKNINGIKQGIENRLHSSGILTYVQLASLTPDEIMASLGKVIGYTTKRIVDENWIGQARNCAQKSETITDLSHPEEHTIRQHYATFTIELLLVEENTVRRTKAVHIQSEAEETWAGWDEGRLVRFITHSAHVQDRKLAAEEPVDNKDITPHQNRAIKPAAPPPVTGTPRIKEVRLISPSTGSQQHIIPQGQPFEIAMTLDMADVQASLEKPFSYHLIAYAKALGKGDRQMLDSAQGTFQPGELTTLQLKSNGLPDGTYRIGVEFSATAPSSQAAHLDLAAMLDGGLIKVY